MTSVKVAVRVRPFNKREKERESRSIISMHPGNLTKIENPVRLPAPVRRPRNEELTACVCRRTERRRSTPLITRIGLTMVSKSQTPKGVTCTRTGPAAVMMIKTKSTRTW